MAVGAATGIAYLHSQQPVILHRDLKSMNLLVSDSFVIKVCDFGLSRSKIVTGIMTRIGTVQWAAPEILREEEYNEKCDVYSFAIVLWELWSHSIPFQGLTPYQIAMDVARKKRRPPLSSSCPKPLSALIRSCWDDNPKMRPEMPAVVRALEGMKDSVWPAKHIKK